MLFDLVTSGQSLVHIKNDVTDKPYCGVWVEWEWEWTADAGQVKRLVDDDQVCRRCLNTVGQVISVGPVESTVVMARDMDGMVMLQVGDGHVRMTARQAIEMGGRLTLMGREAWKEIERK